MIEKSILEDSVELLKLARQENCKDLVYPCSFGLESSILIDLIISNNLSIPIVTVDTGMLPYETHELIRCIEQHYGIEVNILKANPMDVSVMENEFEYDLFRHSIEHRSLCCQVRMVDVLKKYLKGKAWITGRRKFQSDTRSLLNPIEENPTLGIKKYNPILRWSERDVREYISSKHLPYNKLADRGCRSIGCRPCARAIRDDELERQGRWWWESSEIKSECGLHLDPITKKYSRMEKELMNQWTGKRVFITGVCGTVGQELLKQVTAENICDVIGIDNNESALFFLEEEYKEKSNVNLYLGDIRDRDKLIRKMQGVDVVLHAAALKHVLLCEKTPRDPVQTNILGTQNVIDAAIANSVERVIFTSSDKAVNPTNVMGTSKLMGERLMTAANAHGRKPSPIFASTRFGNVLDTRGSVLSLFIKQIEGNKMLTLTDNKMSRFVMTIEEAVKLVMDSVFMAKGGEVFVTKMPVLKIKDLALALIDLLSPTGKIQIQEIGSEPGEKLYEELMNDEEMRRTIELENYFVVLPAFKSIYDSIDYKYKGGISERVNKPYISSKEPEMTVSEIKKYLIKNGLIEQRQEKSLCLSDYDSEITAIK